MSHKDETCRTFTLPKEDPKNILIMSRASFTNTSIFHQKLAIFVVLANKKIILIHNL